MDRKTSRVAAGALAVAVAAALTIAALARLDAARAVNRAAADLRSLGELADGRPTFLYIFQPADCADRRWQIARWSDLNRRGIVRVVGVPLRVADAETEVHARAPGLVRFPLATADAAKPAERALLRMGFTRTPIGLLVDPSGQPRLLVPPPANPDEQARIEELVRSYGAALLAAPPAARPSANPSPRGSAPPGTATHRAMESPPAHRYLARVPVPFTRTGVPVPAEGCAS